MSRLRVFMLWLAMLAVPFQGYAAATMAYCGGHEAAAVAAAVSAHMASAPGPHHGDAKTEPATPSHATGPHAQTDTTFHKCATCSACHGVGLACASFIAALHPLPQADLAEPARAMATLPPRVLDKPPRA